MGPTEGSETAQTILHTLGIAIPKATLVALPATPAPEPREKSRSAEKTLFDLTIVQVGLVASPNNA